MLRPVIAAILLGQTAASAPQINQARRGVWLLILVTLSFAVFLIVVVASVLVRRIRRRQAEQPPRPSGTLVDPWSEAARRVQPFDSRDKGNANEG